jgi:hypothetical protein
VAATALQHFQEDIARAKAIVMHANPLPPTNAVEQLLRSDLLRSAWMFAVGALDAYFCDAYTDAEFLVNRCDEHIASEFRRFLIDVGCSAATIAQAGY